MASYEITDQKVVGQNLQIFLLQKSSYVLI